MIDIEKWKNRIENELTLSKDLCLKEMRLNFTRNDLIELNVLLGSVSEIRNKAIEEFAEQIELGISESIIWDILATASKNGSLSDTSDKIIDYVIETIKETAKSMKGENDEIRK